MLDKKNKKGISSIEQEAIIRTLKDENYLLSSTLTQKIKYIEDIENSLFTTKSRLEFKEQEIETIQYNNLRLTKRVEQLIDQINVPLYIIINTYIYI